MKFRTKLIAGFSCVVFLLSACLGIVYYEYNSKHMSDMQQQNLRFYCEQLASRMDETVDSMKSITDYVLSDEEMLHAITSMPMYHATGKELERKRQLKILTRGISTDYIYRNFYRVIIFNEMGDVAGSTNVGAMMVDKNRDVLQIPWLNQAAERRGKVILLPPHKDGWGAKKSDSVFSIARKVQGGNFGYIEVQNNSEKLKEIFHLPDSNVQVAAWLSDGTLLYRQNGMGEHELEKIFLQVKDRKENLKVKESGIGIAESSNYGIFVGAIFTNKSLLSDMKKSIALSGALAIGCFIFSMLVVVMIASRLSKPITNLREQMENTGIENLDTEPRLLAADNEMEALGIAYQNLIKRLNESMIKEKRLSLLQLQMQFDALQAQVNPHFIYNVLNVISNRGVINGDEEMCEICGSLAAMLRYSTNTVERYATVGDEIEYLRKYIYLLKSRYEHRLEIEIMCEQELEKKILPKIVLQQLVENSVLHGFVNSTEIMRIQVKGWQDEKGWYLQVWDNGQGLTEETLDNLNRKIKKIKSKILTKHSSIEMEIGGMGLVNTYARMLLLYAEDTVFSIRNMRNGASIIIGALEKEDAHVSDIDCRR